MTTERTPPNGKYPHGVLLAAGLLAALLLAAGSATAGECPADKMGVNVTKPGETMAKGVADTVIASIDLEKKSPALKGNKFRMRRLTVEPGGVVPWHSHGERPANIYIVSGSITEYRSSCAVPIEHKAGDVVAEFGADLAHWWRNNGSEPVVIISADIFQEKMPDQPM